MREKASVVVWRRRGAGRADGLGAISAMDCSKGFFSTGFSAGFRICMGEVLIGGAGLDSGLRLSKRAAMEAVMLVGRTVACVDEEILRVGEGLVATGDLGGSGDVVAPRVLSHDGGLLGSAVPDGTGRPGLDGVGVVSFGFSDELVAGASCVALRGEVLGVVGRRVEGECVSGVLGRRNGEVRGLLKDSGDGLYGVGVLD